VYNQVLGVGNNQVRIYWLVGVVEREERAPGAYVIQEVEFATEVTQQSTTAFVASSVVRPPHGLNHQSTLILVL
jgi:hypothetical protein